MTVVLFLDKNNIANTVDFKMMNSRKTKAILKLDFCFTSARRQDLKFTSCAEALASKTTSTSFFECPQPALRMPFQLSQDHRAHSHQ